MRILITGMSGVGKSLITGKLRELGYAAVDLDTDEWSHWVDFAGNPTGARSGKDWVWKEDAVETLLTRHRDGSLFVSGCAANMGMFLPHFDRVILLSAPANVLLQRLANRSSNPYGNNPSEIAAVLRNMAEVEPLLRKIAGEEIDARKSPEEIVRTILRGAG